MAVYWYPIKNGSRDRKEPLQETAGCRKCEEFELMAKDKNMNQDAANDEEMTVTLTLDDGTELECVVLTIFEAADKEYIALLPLDGNEAEDGEVYLYRYTEINGTPDIQNIESDEEYEIVADAFDELLDTEEYDEIVGEDELDD